MLMKLLEKRASVRKFKDVPISYEIIQKLLEAGRLSPSGGNEQSWLFGVITDKGMIEEIASISYGQNWMKAAPLLIVLVTKIVEDERGGRFIQESRYPKLKDKITLMDNGLFGALNMEEHQTKIPGTHMVLQALEYGIGSTWVSYFDVARLAEYLGLPVNYLPSEILVFGYPEMEPKTAKKKELGDIVFYNRYREVDKDVR